MNFESKKYRNKLAKGGAQLVPTGIPVTCPYSALPNQISIIQSIDNI